MFPPEVRVELGQEVCTMVLVQRGGNSELSIGKFRSILRRENVTRIPRGVYLPELSPRVRTLVSDGTPTRHD